MDAEVEAPVGSLTHNEVIDVLRAQLEQARFENTMLQMTNEKLRAMLVDSTEAVEDPGSDSVDDLSGLEVS